MTKVFYASTLFGAMTLAAALDTGQFGERKERRLLLASNNSAVPEILDPFIALRAFDVLRSRFDHVMLWNDVIAPAHPSGWAPRECDVPMLVRMVAGRLGLDIDPADELVVESVAVAPARAIGMLIPDCPITVYSDGLMSYGPTRDEVSAFIGARMQRLLHLDLIPGLTPLLLTEHAVRPEPIPDSAFAKVLAELPVPSIAVDVTGWPVVVGQYLSALGILTPAEEIELYGGFVRGLAARSPPDRVRTASGRRRFARRPDAGAGGQARGDPRDRGWRAADRVLVRRPPS